MRPNQTAFRTPNDATQASDQQARDTRAWEDAMARIEETMHACEALGDDALARHAGRKLFAAVAGAADVLLRDGGKGLHEAPDKIGAFFDKAAAGFVQAVEGMHRRAVLADGAAFRGESAAAARAAHPLAPALATWGAAARE